VADVLVLCYHAVSDEWQHAMSVPPAYLRDQVQSVLERGYRPMTLTDARARPAPRTVVVTFDDGFLSTYLQGRPVLEELGVPATVFLPTSFVSSGQPLSWTGFDPAPLADPRELCPMTWAHARALTDLGWEVGSHSRTHPVLTQTDDERLRAELVESRDELAQHLGPARRTLAYPFGEADRRVMTAAADAGYAAGVTLGCRRRRPAALAVPRVGVYRGDSSHRFALKVSAPARSRAGSLAVEAAKATGALVRSLVPAQRPSHGASAQD